MLKKAIYVLMFFYAGTTFASDHGIYLKLLQNVNGNIDEVTSSIAQKLTSAGFDILALRNVETPSIVRETGEDECSFSVKQILFSSKDYTKFLTKINNKYLLAGFLRLAVYQDEHGIQVNITDPETINRIVFNDLYEDDRESEYSAIVEGTAKFRNSIIDAVHSTGLGTNVKEAMPPIRSDEDLMESSKDMFMMVGPMTFFNDEDQFPVIHSIKSQNYQMDIKKLKSKIKNNIESFSPTKDDIDYRITKSADVLKWRIVGEIYSPDSTALLLGITRPRTEGLSFHIAGSSRESDINTCPGIDHGAAYPIEVLILGNENEISVYTAREMFRMDMYFWDAGMPAFMNHMSMPALLDESLKTAIVGK